MSARSWSRAWLLAPVLAGAAAAGWFAALAPRAASAAPSAARPQASRRACGHMYWTNRHWIGRADLNGTHVDETLITRAGGLFSTGIALTSRYVYWSNPGGSAKHLPKAGHGAIYRANLNGSHVDRTFITGTSLPTGVAIAGRYIYWGNNLTGAIGRARLNGTDVNQRFITTAQPEGPDAVIVGFGHIYWANDYGIGRANLNGTGVNQSFVPVPNGPSGVSGLAVNSRHLYWTDETAGHIGRSNLNGTDVDQRFITGADFPEASLNVTPRYLYWANNDSSTIARANLNGTHVDEHFIKVTRRNLFGLAVQPPCPA